MYAKYICIHVYIDMCVNIYVLWLDICVQHIYVYMHIDR